MESKYPEVRNVLQELINRGFTISSYNDGEENVKTNSLDEVVKAIFSVDECSVVVDKDNKSATLAFCLDCDPGTILYDYSCCEELMIIVDEISSMIYDKYSE